MDELSIRRREFLARTESAAGLAGLGSLPAGTLIAEAAMKQRRALPAPRNLPLDHIVVVMMENRSFDHCFGWLDGADWDQTQSYVDGVTGKRVATRHASSLEAEWQGSYDEATSSSSTRRRGSTRSTTASSAPSCRPLADRYYKWSAQSGGRKDNAPPLETPATSGRRSSTGRWGGG